MNSTKGVISFDLDETIADGCIQAYFFEGVPHHQLMELFSSKMPWCSVVEQLLSKPIQNRTFKGAQKVYQTIPLVKGMNELIKHLHKQGYELILVTGGNKMFAKDYLRFNKLDAYFSQVIANTLQYSQQNGFKYSPFCLKTVKCHSQNCRPPCKKKLIQDYLLQKQKDSKLIYHVGDGHNDFCPMTLTSGAKAFVRKYHVLHDDLQQNSHLIKQIPGQLVYWTSGLDIINHFKQ